MHEYSVVSELVTALLPRLEGHAGKIISVHLKKGELRILSDQALISAFEIVSQGTRLQGATLEIEEVKAFIRCKACEYEGKAEYLRDEAFHFSIPVLTCPHCGSEVDVLFGRELYVNRVTLTTPKAPLEPAPVDQEAG